jgi:uncharacterized iron-regulated protein
MRLITKLLAVHLSVVLAGCSTSLRGDAGSDVADASACVPTGSWLVPDTGQTLTTADVVDDAARRRVVLLGERHDSAEHHRWQLQTLAALHARRPALVVGFEMFPRDKQAALDRWVAGELNEAQFLAEADWEHSWRLPHDLYLPLFHFARMNRVPMRALNVDRDLVSRIAKNGWEGVPEADRAALSEPAPPTPEYERWLEEIFEEHVEDDEAADEYVAGVEGFIDGQLTWDRAFAEGLYAAAEARPDALVVGVIGSGHLENGFGVPHQLAALGMHDVAVLVPWDDDRECDSLSAGLADAVFGVSVESRTAKRPKLGVSIMSSANGVRVLEVLPESVAEAAGLRAGDLIVDAGGLEMKETADLIAVVSEQGPGAELSLRVERGTEVHKLVAKFPNKS